MPSFQPTSGQLHVDRPLTNVATGYLQGPGAFVASRAFAGVPVAKQSDQYFRYSKSAFFRDSMAKRAAGTRSQSAGWTMDSPGSYFCDVWALNKPIPDQLRANQDQPLNLDRDATLFLGQQYLIRKEKLFVSQYMAGSLWTFNQTGVASGEDGAITFRQWNDPASTPIEDVRRWKRTQLQSTAYEPNVLVLGRTVYDALLDHPDILDRINQGQTPGQPAIANRETLAKLFELEEILISNAIENTAAEGAADAFGFIMGKKALLCYRAPAPGIMVPSAGYTFYWTGYAPGQGPLGNVINRYRDDPAKTDFVEIEATFDMKLVSADCGTYIAAAVA